MLLAMSISQKETPFLSALKRLKDSFVAASQEADQLMRDAESVCNPRSYDQKLEKKLNLFRDEESRISVEQAKKAIENFSLTLHKAESPDYSKQDLNNLTGPPFVPEQVIPTSSNHSPHATPESSVTASEVESVLCKESIEKINSPDTTFPQQAEEEVSTHSNMENFISNKYVSTTDVSTIDIYTGDIQAADFTDELEELKERFAEERESINCARLAFEHDIRSVAAIKIQTYWRGYHVHKLYHPKVKRLLEVRVRTIVILQSFYRRCIAIRNYKHLLTQRRKEAIIEIQNWWRVCMAKRLYRELILASESLKRRSAVLIQSAWKRYSCRSAYLKILSEKCRRITAAVCIQSLWRGYVDRKIYTLLLLEARKQEDARIALTNSDHLPSQRIIEATNAADMDSQPTKENDSTLIITQPIDSICLEVVASGELTENTQTLDCTSEDSEAKTTWMHTSSVGAISVQADNSNALQQQQSQTDIGLDTKEVFTFDTALPKESTDPQDTEYYADTFSKENANSQRIYYLLEERRLSWLRGHRIWKDSYRRPVSSSKKRPDPIPAGHKPLSTSQLSARSPDTPLHQIAEVSVAEVRYPVDFSCLNRVPNLLALSLTSCPSVSLEGLQHAPHLTDMYIQHCGVTTADLKGLDNIHFVNFSNNKVTAFTGVLEFSRLIECSISCNRLVHLGELSRCVNLQKLSVNRNILVRGDGLDKLTSLQELSCTHNHLSELPQLSSCCLLASADLSGNNLKRISVFSHPLLTELRLDDNNISNLDALSEAYLPSLRVLSLNGNSICSLQSFSALVLLERLEMKLNYIDNINALLECLQENYRLCVLELDGNPVTQEPRYRESVERALPSLEKLDSWELELTSQRRGRICLSASDDFIKMLERQLEERLVTQSQHSEKIRELESCLTKNPDSTRTLLNARIEQSKETHRLAVHQLREHEYYGTDKAKCDFTSSIITLQSYTRAYIARSCYRIFIANARAAVIIQKQWRGYRARKIFKIQLRSVVVIQAYFRGWWVRSRLSEALKSLQDMNDSDGEDVEELCVDNWEEHTLTEDRIELPLTPMGLYDDIMERYLAPDAHAILDPDRNCPSKSGGVSLPNIHPGPLRDSSTDKDLPLAWASRNSSNITVASNRTEHSSVTETESRVSIDEAIPLEQRGKQLDSANDPWFLNNEQSIALFNKRAKKFKQGKRKKEERTKLQDPFKRLEKLHTGYGSSLHSPTKRAIPNSSRLSSCSVSSHSSSIDLIFKWSNTNQKGSSETNPLKSDKETKRSFLPKIPSRVRAGYSPQLLNDFDSP